VTVVRVPELRARGTGIVPLLIARALRDFGDGFVAVLLPVYLIALGFSVLQVGVIATSALLGSASLTMLIGLIGARFNQRGLLLAAACLMCITGVAFAAVHDYAPLLLVAFAGTINPSAGSVSVFVPLEHTVLSRIVGALASGFGALAASAPDFLQKMDVDRVAAIKLMFLAYALLGVFGGLLYRFIPVRPRSVTVEGVEALGPSRRIVYKLAALFSIDAFAGGFVVQSLLALWLFQRFDLSLSAASLFFFWSGVLSAFSFPVAAWLSKRIGLVNTMVWTHVPSSLCLILAAVAPKLTIALVLLLIRAALSQMDVPTRSSYVMAVVTEPERPAAASFTSVPRSLAAAVSPAMAGALFAASFQALPLIICGSLKIIYDLLLLLQFRLVKPPEERQL
jgi:MFS family permease